MAGQRFVAEPLDVVVAHALKKSQASLWARAWAAQYQIYSVRFLGDLETRQSPGPMQSGRLAHARLRFGLPAPLSGLMRMSLLKREVRGFDHGRIMGWQSVKDKKTYCLTFAPARRSSGACVSPTAIQAETDRRFRAHRAGCARTKAPAMPAMPAPRATMAARAKPISMSRSGVGRVRGCRRGWSASAASMPRWPKNWQGPVHALSLTRR